MADNLDDGEFWLPPQFLTDDDDGDDLAPLSLKNDDVMDVVSKPIIFPYLSSSSETESDEEDHLAELTRRVALELDLNSENPKGVFGGGSPQSTLSAFGSSGKGSSPNGAVPPANSSTWDLLRAAAGEVERMRLGDDNRHDRYNRCNSYGLNFLKPSPVAANGVTTGVTNGVAIGFYSQQQQQQQQPSLSQQQLQIAQFQMLRQQQQSRMVPNRGRNNNNNNNNVARGGGNVSVGLGLSASAWPHGSGMRAVFLAGKRESTGTGVFLPRCVDTRSNNESRKKPVCKTAFVPDRVAQALNLNLDGVAGGHLQHQQQHKPRFNGENGSAVSRGRNNDNNNNNNNNYGNSRSYQKRNNMKLQQTQVVNHDIQLPKEWTY